MKKWAVILFIGLIFYLRFAFLITVMAEERTLGGFYEPVRVVGVKMDETGNPRPIIIPSENEEFSKEKKIGPILFHIRTSIKDPHPVVKLKIFEREFQLLHLSYVGVLPFTYIPKIYIEIFGKSIYSVRSFFLFILLIFLTIYNGFVKRYKKENHLLISIYLITFPIFGLMFAAPFLGNAPMIFITLIGISMMIKNVLNNSSITSKELVLFFFLFGCILNFHLLAGGAILFSIILSLLLTEKNISFRIKTLLLIFGIFIFLLLVFPYAFTSIIDLKSILFRGKGSFQDFLLLPFYSIFYYLTGLFFGPSFAEVFLHDKIDIKYIPFSIPSGIIMGFGFLGLFSKKKEKSEKFLLLLCLFYIIITIFADIRPYHISYILPFLSLFIVDGLKSSGLKEKTIKFVLIIGIFLNIIQIEMLRDSIKNSSLSLSLHKEVKNYLIKNGIRKIHNIAGMYDYVFISEEKIEVIDFIPFIGYNHPQERIYLSLLLSKGEVVLLESYKRAGITTGVSLEEVMDIAEKTGLKLKVLKKFPDEGRYELVLIRVE